MEKKNRKKYLYRPSSSISKSTNSMSFDLLWQFPHHVNFGYFSFSINKAPHHFIQPTASFSARGTLSTAFMFIEKRQSGNTFYNIGLNNMNRNKNKQKTYLLVHDNNSSSSKTRLSSNKCIKIHQNSVTNGSENDFYKVENSNKKISNYMYLKMAETPSTMHYCNITNILGQKRNRWSTRNNSQQIIPSSNYSTTMAFDKFFQRDRHFLFNSTGIVYMSGNAEKLNKLQKN